MGNVWTIPQVGVTGLEPVTLRPPDECSGQTELHPEICPRKGNASHRIRTCDLLVRSQALLSAELRRQTVN